MRKDCTKGWLGRDRMKSIFEYDTFVCHKDNSRQCAGHMLMRGDDNIFVKTAKAEKIKLNLSGRELLFDTVDDCINHHKNN